MYIEIWALIIALAFAWYLGTQSCERPHCLDPDAHEDSHLCSECGEEVDNLNYDLEGGW